MSWLFKEASHAQLYLKYRPNYPSSVYTTIVGYLRGDGASGLNEVSKQRTKLALDVGCGSGQSTLPLSEHFESVIGVDNSEAQLEKAREASEGNSNVTYRLSQGHDLAFQQDNSVDLVTVAQALHWIDGDKFYPECRRVLRTSGVLAAYGYGTPRIEGSRPAQELLANFYWHTLKGYWDPGRSHIDDLMSRVFQQMKQHFPLSTRDDSMVLQKTYTVEDFIGYLSSWSGYQKYCKVNPNLADPLEEVYKQLSKVYTGTSLGVPIIHVVSPIFLLLARND